MNQEVASIMNRFYSLFPCKIYTDDVPEQFVVPSMYFPPAVSFDTNDTNMTYAKTFTLTVKLFHKDRHSANNAAEVIADGVRRKRNVIPVINQDGSSAGDFIRISRLETRVSDDGFATIVVNWDSRYFYERETWPSLENFDFKESVR